MSATEESQNQQAQHKTEKPTTESKPNETPDATEEIKVLAPQVPPQSEELQKTANNESAEDQPEKEECLENMTLDQVLKVNTQLVDFGEVFPGQIVEETLIILNNLSNTKIPFKIKVNCLTKEFDELDEYVYSMRRPSPNDVFNYNDTFLILLAQKAISYYKLAVKVPLYREEAEILGNVVISSAECPKRDIVIPVRSRIVLPNVKCEKLITMKSLNMSLIKLYMKTPKRQDFRITLKNVAKAPCVGEPVVLKNEEKASFLEFVFYPAQLTLNQFVATNFMMSVKSSLPENDEISREVRAVLIIKIRNSAALFAFPIIILIGDGKGTETVS